VRGSPDLVGDYCHHEQEVESKGPEDQEFGAFEVTTGDGVLFGFDELIVFEGREDPGLIGGRGLFFLDHEIHSPISQFRNYAVVKRLLRGVSPRDSSVYWHD
jgi:hypothetical protein